MSCFAPHHASPVKKREEEDSSSPSSLRLVDRQQCALQDLTQIRDDAMASKMASMMMAKRSLSSAASSGSKKFLITGGNGCIGAWVVKRLLERGHEPVIFDLGGDLRRIRELTPIYPHPLN